MRSDSIKEISATDTCLKIRQYNSLRKCYYATIIIMTIVAAASITM